MIAFKRPGVMPYETAVQRLLARVPSGMTEWRVVVHHSEKGRYVGCALGTAPALPLEAELPELPCDAWEVDRRFHWDDGGVTLQRIVFVHRIAAIDHEQFASHWTNNHTPLARKHHPALVRYAQHVVLRPLTEEAEAFDGFAELGFPSEEAMENHMYDSPEGEAVIAADVATFLDIRRGTRVLGTPHVAAVG